MIPYGANETVIQYINPTTTTYYSESVRVRFEGFVGEVEDSTGEGERSMVARGPISVVE